MDEELLKAILGTYTRLVADVQTIKDTIVSNSDGVASKLQEYIAKELKPITEVLSGLQRNDGTTASIKKPRCNKKLAGSQVLPQPEGLQHRSGGQIPRAVDAASSSAQIPPSTANTNLAFSRSQGKSLATRKPTAFQLDFNEPQLVSQNPRLHFSASQPTKKRAVSKSQIPFIPTQLPPKPSQGLKPIIAKQASKNFFKMLESEICEFN